MNPTSNDDVMNLEPRLLEYLTKKRYYKQNNISEDDLEINYNITKRDIARIKAYLRGDNRTYNKACFSDFVDPTQGNFPSQKFEKDPRFDRLKRKQERDREAVEQRKNYGIISRGYDMYREDRQFASAFGDDFCSKTDPNKEWKENPNIAPSQCNYDSMARRNTYDVNTPIVENQFTQPKSKFNGYIPYDGIINEDPNSLDNIINNLSGYTKTVSRVMNKPEYNGAIGKFRESENNRFDSEPQRTQISDVDIETYCKFGQTPSRAGKSLGYPNPVEHYFDYISDDMQRPEHVVSNRPVDTRHLNKKVARPFDDDVNKRKIMK